MILLNCLLYAWYGLHFVSKNNILLSPINGTGAAIEAVYVFIFILFAPRKEKAKIFGLLMLVLAVFGAVVLVSLFALHGNTRRAFCGFAAAILSIIMYASPYSIMGLVIKTKSVEFMPFFLSIWLYVNANYWFLFGMTGHDYDYFVSVPNGFGCALGAFQLVWYCDISYQGEGKKPIYYTSVETSPEKAHQVANGSNDEQV